jgi:hypothetical protein
MSLTMLQAIITVRHFAQQTFKPHFIHTHGTSLKIVVPAVWQTSADVSEERPLSSTVEEKVESKKSNTDRGRERERKSWGVSEPIRVRRTVKRYSAFVRAV